MRILNRELAMQSWRDPNIDNQKNNNWMRRYFRDLKLEYLLQEAASRENIENNPLNMCIETDMTSDTISH